MGATVTKEQEIPNDGLLKVKGLAAHLGVSEATVYRKRSLGEELPPAIRVGRGLRWRKVDVDAWLTGQMERSVAD